MLRNHPQFGGGFHVGVDPKMFSHRAFQMIEVLLERLFIKLGEEVRLNRGVELADIFDELTFGHKVFTFADVPLLPRHDRSAGGSESGIGYLATQT